jgi:ABC-2 type transport system permease protein
MSRTTDKAPRAWPATTAPTRRAAPDTAAAPAPAPAPDADADADTDRETRTGWAGRRETLHAEWTKLRTLPGTIWLVSAIAALTFAVSAAAAAAVTCPTATCGQDPAKVSLTGVDLSQAVAAILGVLIVSSEYSTSMIRLTFAAMPRRTRVLAAKTTLATGLTLVAGTVGVLASVLTARYVMPGHGFTAAHGYPPLSLTDPSLLRAAAGSVLYLALIALLSLGIATLVRDSAAAIGIVLGLLYLSPIIAATITDPTWHNRLERYLPMNAGLAIQATRNLAALPIGPWEGLAVLAAWTAAALLAGSLALHLRDA